MDVADYVLNNFSKSEEVIVSQMVDFIVNNISDLLGVNISLDDISRFIAKYINQP
jgi:peptidyl-tRNA hydrolase